MSMFIYLFGNFLLHYQKLITILILPTLFYDYC